LLVAPPQFLVRPLEFGELDDAVAIGREQSLLRDN